MGTQYLQSDELEYWGFGRAGQPSVFRANGLIRALLGVLIRGEATTLPMKVAMHLELAARGVAV